MAEIRWFGRNSFRIKGREAVVMTDPLSKATGYKIGKQTADIVTISNGNEVNGNLNAVKPGFRVVNRPGEYEISDVFVTGIKTYQDGAKGSERGANTAFLIELEGMVFAHLGDLGHALNAEQAEELANCDILMVPAGGGAGISPQVAAEIVAQLEPKVVLPMHYRTAMGDRDLAPLDDFLKALGVTDPKRADKLSLKSGDLAESMQVIVLTPDSDAG